MGKEKVSDTYPFIPFEYEEVIKELFETGKTRAKVTGFVSKAGNQFDTCLKYEDERISFDFDNPGESTPEENVSEKPFYEEAEQPTASDIVYSVQAESGSVMREGRMIPDDRTEESRNSAEQEKTVLEENSFTMYDDMSRFDSFAEEMAAEQARETEEQLAGSNFLDDFMP